MQPFENDYMGAEDMYLPHSGVRMSPNMPAYDEIGPKIGDAQGLAAWGSAGCPPNGGPTH